MSLSCSSCGHENRRGANFCSSCGAEMRSATSSETEQIIVTDAGDAELDQVEPGVAVLVVRQGPKRGSRIALDAAVVTIGRQEDSDIFLDDITVSRSHARIERTTGGFLVRDNGSLNGTYVNKVLVDSVELADGDELQVGKFKLVYLALGADV